MASDLRDKLRSPVVSDSLGGMKPLALAPFVALVCACATMYEVPPSTAPVAEVSFIGLGSTTPFDSIALIDQKDCKPLKNVEPVRSTSGMVSYFPLGQPISLMVSYHGMHRSAYGNTPFRCSYAFTFTPEVGKEYQIRAKAPTQSSWKTSDAEAQTSRFPNRLPDRANCVADVLERRTANGGWGSADRERICGD